MDEISWTIEKQLCRCCLAEGEFNNLESPSFNDKTNQMETYSDMLQECLSINLSSVDGALGTVTYAICSTCTLRLKEALTFRQQVLASEQRFQEMVASNCIKVAQLEYSIVKVEIPSDHEESCFDPADVNSEDEVLCPRRKCKVKQKVKSKSEKKLKKEKHVKEKQGKQKVIKPTQPKKRHDRIKPQDIRQEGDSIVCVLCEKKYNNMSAIRYHIRSVHYQIPRYTCETCSKGFKTPAKYTAHKLDEHNIDDRFKCNACKGAFNTRIQLRRHINIFHMLGEKLYCEFCDYECYSIEGMYKHKFKHKTTKDYHCRFCKKSFLRKTTLVLHEKIHTGDKRQVCKVCKQAFVQKASLNYHMGKHHPEVVF